MDIIDKYQMLYTAVEDAGYDTLLGQMLMSLTNKVLNQLIDINNEEFIDVLQDDLECYSDYEGENTDQPCSGCPLYKLCESCTK